MVKHDWPHITTWPLDLHNLSLIQAWAHICLKKCANTCTHTLPPHTVRLLTTQKKKSCRGADVSPSGLLRRSLHMHVTPWENTWPLKNVSWFCLLNTPSHLSEMPSLETSLIFCVYTQTLKESDQWHMKNITAENYWAVIKALCGYLINCWWYSPLAVSELILLKVTPQHIVHFFIHLFFCVVAGWRAPVMNLTLQSVLITSLV